MKNFIDKLKYYNQNISLLTKIIFGFIILYLLYNLKVIFNNPIILFQILLLILSLLIHEIAHGFAAYIFGDNTAKNRGRLSLNPLHHIDPLGVIVPILLILSGSSVVIGWAKPVPINYYELKGGRFGEFCVAIAGVLANLILAIIGFYFFRHSPYTNKFGMPVLLTIYFIQLNLILAIFNIIPIPPLDGSRVLAALGNRDLRNAIFYVDRFGIVIIFILLEIGVISKFINPMLKYAINFLDKII